MWFKRIFFLCFWIMKATISYSKPLWFGYGVHINLHWLWIHIYWMSLYYFAHSKILLVCDILSHLYMNTVHWTGVNYVQMRQWTIILAVLQARSKTDCKAWRFSENWFCRHIVLALSIWIRSVVSNWRGWKDNALAPSCKAPNTLQSQSENTEEPNQQFASWESIYEETALNPFQIWAAAPESFPKPDMWPGAGCLTRSGKRHGALLAKPNTALVIALKFLSELTLPSTSNRMRPPLPSGG